MSGAQDRLVSLVLRGERQRLALADQVDDLREEFDRRRWQWRLVGLVAGGLAAGGTAAYKLFGKGSIAAKIGRYSSAASLLLGLGRAALRLRRFF